jgi:hypothetical protein
MHAKSDVRQRRWIDEFTLPRPRRAAQRLRRLAEGAAHPLRIAEAGHLCDAFDRVAGQLHVQLLRPLAAIFDFRSGVA